MDDGLKQRLVGAIVLIALALVFLPTLFHRDQRIAIDQSSQLPTKPVFEPVIIEPPPTPNVATYKPVEQVFQPVVPNTEINTANAEESKPNQPRAQELRSELAEPRAGKSETATQAEATKPDTKVVTPEVAPKPETAVNLEAAEPVEPPSLSPSGVAKSWVLQVASFKDSERAQAFAQTLIDKGYRAFVKTSTIASGKVSRIFVGPHIDKQSALTLKRQLDTDMKVNSLVVEFTP